MQFNAQLLGRAWANARKIRSKDEGRPALRAMVVDRFPVGLRIVTTDSYRLLVTWVPSVDDELEHWPADDDEPTVSITVYDDANLVGAVCATADKLDLVDVTVTPDGLTAAGGHRLSTPEIKLWSSDVDFPSWKQFFKPTAPDPTFARDWTKTIHFNASYLAELATICGGDTRDTALRLDLLDHLKPVVFSGHGSHHRGLLMPVRVQEGP